MVTDDNTSIQTREIDLDVEYSKRAEDATGPILLTLPRNSYIKFWMHENPTTGYSWGVDDSNCGDELTFVEEAYHPPMSFVMGAAGRHHWTF